MYFMFQLQSDSSDETLITLDDFGEYIYPNIHGKDWSNFGIAQNSNNGMLISPGPDAKERKIEVQTSLS